MTMEPGSAAHADDIQLDPPVLDLLRRADHYAQATDPATTTQHLSERLAAVVCVPPQSPLTVRARRRLAAWCRRTQMTRLILAPSISMLLTLLFNAPLATQIGAQQAPSTTSWQQTGALDSSDAPVAAQLAETAPRLGIADSNGLRLWNIAGESPTTWAASPLTASNSTEHLAVSQDGSRTASSSEDGTIRLWEPLTRHTVSLHLTANLSAIAFSPDYNTLATGGKDGTVTLWRIAFDFDPKPLVAWDTHTRSPVTSLAFSPDGRSLAVGCDDGIVQVWMTRQARVRLCARLGPKTIAALAFNRSGTQLAAAAPDGSAWLLDPSAPRRHDTVGPPQHEDATSVSIQFAPDDRGLTLALVTPGGGIQLWSHALT